MQPSLDALVYIVDDDASVRDGLAWLLRSRHLPSQAFDSAEAFDAMLQAGFTPTQPCCLLLDVRMPGMSGLALFERLVERGLPPVVPVIGNTTAQLLTTVAAIQAELTAQLTGSVRWTASMQLAMNAGVTSYVEIGPGDVLTGLVKRIDRGGERWSLNSSSSVQEYTQKFV